LVKIFKKPYETADKLATFLGLLIPLLGYLFPKYRGALVELVWQIPVAILIVLACFRILVSPYLVYLDLHQKYLPLLQEQSSLLEIVFEPTASFIKKGTLVDYYVGLLNKGMKSVDDPSLMLTSIEPSISTETPFLIENLQGNTIHPNQKFPSAFIKLFRVFGNHRGEIDSAIIYSPRGGTYFKHGNYILTLTAEARDISPTTQRFNLQVNEEEIRFFPNEELSKI
jgi:hypothetical protein